MSRTLPALAVAAGLMASGAQAATLRATTDLAGPSVLLSDLFDDAGPMASRALGPSPAPGGSIVVGAAQLAAIARDYGVDWRPASSADQATLQRPGMAVPREAVMRALRQSLSEAGAPDGDVSLPGFVTPMVSVQAAPSVAVEQLALADDEGRFTAGLVVTGRHMAPLRLRVSGRVQAMQTVAVATHRLLPGDVVGPGDLRPARVASLTLHAAVLQDAAQAQGMTLRRPVAAGQPVPVEDLGRPDMVSRGDRVAMRLRSGGIELTAAGQALDAGGQGQRIRVLNPSSRAIVLALVTAPDTVTVDADTTPIRAGTDASAATGSELNLR